MRQLCTSFACLGAVAGLATVARAAIGTNNWDTDIIYVLRKTNSGLLPDGEIRKLNEAASDPTHSDRGPFGASLAADGKPKSICFSNSPTGGLNSPAGARLWGVVNDPADLGEPHPTSFRVFEFSADGTQVRNFYAGLAGGGTGNGELNGSNGRVYVGNIRYNSAKKTLAVAANLGQENASGYIIPGTARGMVYEFALPDWPASPNWVTPTLVQRYEMPAGHSVSRDNGNIDVPLVIDFDDDGNMYVGGQWFDANGDGWRDVIRFSTLGHNAGLNTYVVPITGPNAANLLIDGYAEYNIHNNSDWPDGGGGQGLAVRTTTNQLVVLPTADCVDLRHTLIYDLTRRRGGGPTGNLVLVKRLEDLSYLPRIASYAQRDADSGKIYFCNLLGDCGGAQNLMYLANDSPTDTVAQNVGYFLAIACNDNCDLNKTWDAASPPPPPASMTGACCMAGNRCEQATRADCTGVWLGAGSVCGESACPAMCGDPAMDVDGDGDVDMDDFSVLQRCFSGAGSDIPADPPTCFCFDRGSGGPDYVIDMADVRAFETCLSRANVPANPSCD